MPALTLGMNAYQRDLAAGAPIKLFNMLLEPDPTNEIDGLMRIQRPGLVREFDMGSGAMRGVGVRYSGDLSTFGAYLVSGTTLIRVVFATGQILGTIPGSDLVDIAVGPDRVLIVAGGVVYSSAGGAATVVTIPDDRPIAGAAFLGGYFVLPTADGSRVYWIDPGETDPHALNFFSAESNPDRNTAIKTVGEEVWVFGVGTVEPFILTGDPDAPFQRLPGRTMLHGTFARNAIVQTGDVLIFVDHNRQVWMWGGGLQKISTNGIDERLRGPDFDDYTAWTRAWSFSLDGHICYVLTIPGEGTFVYDLTTKAWSEFGSEGQTGWRAHLGFQADPTVVLAGDDSSNTLWRLTPGYSQDDGGPMTRTISGGVTVLGKPVTNASLEIRCATGKGNDLVDSDELLYRYSDDEGNTWTDWDSESMGATGKYGGLVTIRRQGVIEAPGRIYEFQYSGNGPFRVSYARIAEAIGGKPRASGS